MIDREKPPTLDEVARVAGMHRSHLGIIVNELADELGIKLPKRNGNKPEARRK